MNSTLGSVVPLAMFYKKDIFDLELGTLLASKRMAPDLLAKIAEKSAPPFVFSII